MEDTALSLLRELAEVEPLYNHGYTQELTDCLYCDGREGAKGYKHTEGCSWLRAKEYIRRWDAQFPEQTGAGGTRDTGEQCTDNLWS